MLWVAILVGSNWFLLVNFWFNVGGGYWRLVVRASLYVGCVYESVLTAAMRCIDIG